MDKILVDIKLLQDLRQVCDWHISTVSSLRNGETPEYHPDWNAVEYLASETQAIMLKLDAVLEHPPAAGQAEEQEHTNAE